MGGACSTFEEMRSSHKILIRIPKEKRQLKALLRDNIKLDVT
jgi:hypothetical protein